MRPICEMDPFGRHLILIDMAGVEPEFLEGLARAHAAALVLYARQWCGTPEDVVQEAFLKLVVQKSPPNNPVPWLYRVVRNAALAASRAERRRRHHETIAAGRVPAWFVESDIAGLDVGATTAALRSLPPSKSEVLVARIWGGLTFEQIGETVGCSAATAYRTYVAGLSALREKLGVPCPNKPITTTDETPV
jgi:RNA polymerase sigma factor (sigma-70 family)